jgi:hypothetical protein
MRRIGTSLLSASALAIAGGCSSPELADARWSAQQPVVFPAAAPRSVRGALTVTCERSSPTGEWEKDRRGFAIFDAAGTRVLSVAGSRARERLTLAPGRYVVVSVVGEGFDRHLERTQVVVESGAETAVDFTCARGTPTAAVHLE